MLQRAADRAEFVAFVAKIPFRFFKRLNTDSIGIHNRAGRCRFDLGPEFIHHCKDGGIDGFAAFAKVAL